MNKRLYPSKFNAYTNSSEGDLILFNSYTGALAIFTEAEQPTILKALNRNGIDDCAQPLITHMKENGFLVPEHIDEKKRAQFLHQSLHRTDTMHLVIMPTESCNFRCTYCYESFLRGKMKEPIIRGLQLFLNEKAKVIQNLSVSWFGGEPLLALDVIKDISTSILQIVKEKPLNYSSDLVTNGYLLTPEVFTELINLEIRQFMITIDGLDEIHDQRRYLAGGGNTFNKIIENLKAMKQSEEDFQLTIRVNFDQHNIQEIPRLIEFLSEHFSNDKRFQMMFRPVGQWGGKNDDNLPICNRVTSDKKMWDFTLMAMAKGLKLSSIIENSMMPTGSVCYAAKPQSLVVGPDGSLYKCTVSFEESINQVGHLHEDGTIDLDYDKVMMWTTSGEETDEGCQSCFYRPACQGNHCPYYRMITGERPCPYEKRKIKKMLQLIWENEK